MKVGHVNKFKFMGVTPLYQKKECVMSHFVTKNRNTYSEVANELLHVAKIDFHGRCFFSFCLRVDD